MPAYRILTPTLGRVEAIQLLQQAGLPTLDPLIEWSWWCRGWLRRRHYLAATKLAGDILKRELACEPERPREIRWTRDESLTQNLPPQGFAVQVSVAMGFGLPDEWRRVRYRDVIFALRFKSHRETLEKDRGPAPVWGEAEAA